MNGPIRWFGGKGRMQSNIAPLLPECPLYVEPFGGGASILLAREPVGVEIYNDIDPGLYDFFTVIANPALFEAFYRRVAPLPYSRQVYNECRTTWQDTEDRIARVAKWFVVARQSFSGDFGHSWSSSVTESRRGMVSTASRWLSCIDRLPEIHARLQRVQIECADWRDILRRYDTPDTLFYCDPPYVHSTRSSTRYPHEMSDDDHREFITAILGIKGMAAVSGYQNEIYASLDDAGWTRYDWKVLCGAAGRTRGSGLQGKGSATKKQSRTESLWLSPRA